MSGVTFCLICYTARYLTPRWCIGFSVARLVLLCVSTYGTKNQRDNSSFRRSDLSSDDRPSTATDARRGGWFNGF